MNLLGFYLLFRFYYIRIKVEVILRNWVSASIYSIFIIWSSFIKKNLKLTLLEIVNTYIYLSIILKFKA